jgi:hypothetical protein
MGKNFARFAAAAILATGIFAGGSGPANAAPDSSNNTHLVTPNNVDTGWD